jgi:DNA repair exonuclease SbcCD ATPase subunit
MIIFEKISYQNFIMSGNNPIVFDFQKSPLTLIIGKNGAGKSTVIDAISFALFGKAYRKIKKTQMINSINSKGTLVVLELNVNGNSVVIRRGIKPDVFSIIFDGNVVKEESGYQEILDKITGLNPIIFQQIIALSSSSFEPFMRLSIPNRRMIVENLLDIRIFSIMSIINKKKLLDLNRKKDIFQLEIESYNKNIFTISQMISQLSSHDIVLKESLESIRVLENEIGTKRKKFEEILFLLSNEYPSVNSLKINENIEKNQLKINELQSLKTLLLQEHANICSEVKFFEDNIICPTCKDVISALTKENILKKQEDKLISLADAIPFLTEKINKVSIKIQNEKRKKSIVENLEKEKEILINGIQILETQLKKTVDSYEKNKIVVFNNTEELQTKLKTTEIEREEKKYKLSNLLTEVQKSSIISKILQDDGLKKEIVSYFVPQINKLVNKFLDAMGFFVLFELDENFFETIKSRHRDIFSYESFSEGQKQRIDMALLFAWREIALLRNSVKSNLLILDEVFDKSLDDEGHQNLMKILETLGEDKKNNIFVISHKEELIGAFPDTIEFVYNGNFSEIAQQI